MHIYCKYDKLIPIDSLTLDENNRNKHPDEQIDRLAKVIEYQGMRWPVIVSKLSGVVKAGEGRVLALKKLGEFDVPVVFQEFLSKDQEYAFGISDNAIASWADIDLSGVNADLSELDGMDFDVDVLGIRDFTVEPLDKFDIDQDQKDGEGSEQHTCPKCGFEWQK